MDFDKIQAVCSKSNSREFNEGAEVYLRGSNIKDSPYSLLGQPKSFVDRQQGYCAQRAQLAKIPWDEILK